jgi:hypothetical protein
VKVSHSLAALFAAFDDPDLRAHAGLVPAIRQAAQSSLTTARITTGAPRSTSPPARTRRWPGRFHRHVDSDRPAHGHANEATQLPVHDPKNLGDPAPDVHRQSPLPAPQNITRIHPKAMV